MPKTPAQVAQRYKDRVAQSGQSYRDGVASPSRSWANGYTQNVNRMVMGFQQAVAAGKPQQAVQQLGDAGWQRKTLDKADRYASSATRAAEGYAAIATKVMQAATAGQQAAMNIDGTTFEGRLDRMRANAIAISNAWK